MYNAHFNTHFDSRIALPTKVEHQGNNGDHLSKVNAERQIQRDKERFADGELGLGGDAEASGAMEGDCLSHPAGDSIGNS